MGAARAARRPPRLRDSIAKAAPLRVAAQSLAISRTRDALWLAQWITLLCAVRSSVFQAKEASV